MTVQLSPLALTIGDPAGIGPEVAIKALHALRSDRSTRVLIVGDLGVLEAAARVVGGTLPLRVVSSPSDVRDDAINVLDMGLIRPGDFRIGQVSAACGKAAYGYIIRAIELAKSGEVAGVVTNPINKEALKAAGINYPGHTEIFAHETGTTDFSMMFKLGSVAVVHVTTHCSLRQAIGLVTRDRVASNIRLLHRTLRRLGVERPRIAVGGLNPHAGEHGLFGDEESLHIEPAIVLAVKEGIDARGPFPPDTVFMRAFRGEFDGVVSMLHDHGFVALKTKNFDEGVNITVGLPIIRTSVGHGTAFDIAGTGKASEKSLLAAIEAAKRLSQTQGPVAR